MELAVFACTSSTLGYRLTVLQPGLPSSSPPRFFSLPLPLRFAKLGSSTRLVPSSQFRRLGSSAPADRLTSLAVSAQALTLDEEQTEPLPADILVSENQEPNSSVRLSVEVPPIVSQDCHKKVLAELAKRVKVPGFRPGKRVPENILISYVGREQLRRATIESILKRTLPNAMSTVKGRALKDSIRIVTNFSEMNEAFSLEDVFRFDVKADLAPEVKWVSEDKYKNMKIVVEIDNTITAEIASEKEFNRRHKALGALKIVTERGLKIGDLAVLDIFAKKVEEDESEGEKIPSAEKKGFHLDTEECENLLPGFLDAILEIRQGETRQFQFVFPENWEQENLRGTRAQFTVVCQELFYRELPELNDSLAEQLLPGCSTLNEVRESILERCREVEQTATEQATDNAILDQLSKMVEVEVPQSMFEEQGRQLYGAKLLQIQAERKLDPKQLEYFSSEKAVKEYLEGQSENITNLIKQMLAVGYIFKCENLQFSTDELVKEVESSVTEFKRHNQEYDEERIREQVQEVLEGAKVLEWLKENIEIQYKRR